MGHEAALLLTTPRGQFARSSLHLPFVAPHSRTLRDGGTCGGKRRIHRNRDIVQPPQKRMAYGGNGTSSWRKLYERMLLSTLVPN